jgi:hypothetical protein
MPFWNLLQVSYGILSQSREELPYFTVIVSHPFYRSTLSFTYRNWKNSMPFVRLLSLAKRTGSTATITTRNVDG